MNIDVKGDLLAYFNNRIKNHQIDFFRTFNNQTMNYDEYLKKLGDLMIQIETIKLAGNNIATYIAVDPPKNNAPTQGQTHKE